MRWMPAGAIEEQIIKLGQVTLGQLHLDLKGSGRGIRFRTEPPAA